MKRKKPLFFLYCTLVMVLIDIYEFYLTYRYPNLPILRDWILLNVPYELILNIVIITLPVVLFIFWLLEYLEYNTKARSKYYRAKPRKVKHIAVNNYKWEVRIYKDEEFFMDEIPFCAKHNLRLVSNGTQFACPKLNKDHCQSRFLLNDFEKIYKSARSIIENQIKFHGIGDSNIPLEKTGSTVPPR